MARAGFIMLVMVFIIPCVMSRSTRYDKYHFYIALAMYSLSMLGIALIAIDD